jgi:hypothetical protein
MNEYMILSAAAILGSISGMAFSLAILYKNKKPDNYREVLDSCEFHTESEIADEGG